MSALSAVQSRHESWHAPGTERCASGLLRDVLERLDGLLSELGEVSLGALADADVVRLLDATTAAASRLTREVCRAAAEADLRRLGDATGARHTHQWWAGRSRHTQADAARLTALGRALEDDLHARTARALADGALRVEQARVIVQAVEALVEYVERYPADHTPQTAGVIATVVVTMTVEQLLGEHATALLDDGTRMSAGQARRLACEAGIIPVVLGSRSQPLDLGRTARLFTKVQRIALGLRDGGCTARGCETSASGCLAHHDDPWSRHGPTDLADGRLLCPRHHRLAHDHRSVMTVQADNQVTFTRRT
nr:HNH endonuclease signature motif containing protein [uncultured Nocardioides sp.]